MSGEGPPPAARYRMGLRIAVVAAGYGLYRLVEPGSLMAGILLWAGTVALGFAIVDRYATRRSERSGLMQVGTTILGLGLLSVGAYLVLR